MTFKMAAMSDHDFAFALQLQEQFDAENAAVDSFPPATSPGSIPWSKSPPSKPSGFSPSDISGLGSGSCSDQLHSQKKGAEGSPAPASLIDPAWEMIDPNPDARVLFMEFNRRYFWGKLDGVEVRWSPRMTSCAGMCCYEGQGGLCSVRLSQPLLILRPRKDLVETLLHEMIHAYLFVTNDDRDRDDHGPNFCSHMHRLNKLTGAKITIYHSFHDEVENYQTHWWRCDGPCVARHPFYGVVKRAMNRAPSPNDVWWAEHVRTCGGTFTKIREPEGFGDKKKKNNKKEVAEAAASVGTSKITDWMKASASPRPTLSKPTNHGSDLIDLDTDDMSDLELISVIQRVDSDNKFAGDALRHSDAFVLKLSKDSSELSFPGHGNILGRKQVEAFPSGSSSAAGQGLAANSAPIAALFRPSSSGTNARVNSVAGSFLSKALSSAGKLLKENPCQEDSLTQPLGKILKEIPNNVDPSSSMNDCDAADDVTVSTRSLEVSSTAAQRKRMASNVTPITARPRLEPHATPTSSETIRKYLTNPRTPVGATVLVPNFTSVCNARAHCRKQGKGGDGATAGLNSPVLEMAPAMKKQRVSPDSDSESEFTGVSPSYFKQDESVVLDDDDDPFEIKSTTNVAKMSDAFDSTCLKDMENYDMEDEDYGSAHNWIDLTEPAGKPSSAEDRWGQGDSWKQSKVPGSVSGRLAGGEGGRRDGGGLESDMELGDRSIAAMSYVALSVDEKGESGSAADMVSCPICAQYVNPSFINDHIDACLRAS